MRPFAAYFEAVHGMKPFPWQERLADRVLREGWPERLQLPTGSGKTSLLDVAVYALAAEAERPSRERLARRRVFFVIDRRVIVDEAYERARRIEERLEERAPDVAEQLKRYGGSRPLAARVLRGGLVLQDDWCDEPQQPMIVVSTVDQTGSRLLFRGYGLSESRRPMDAALVAVDAHIFLDEAHLSEPFRQTVEAVRRLQEYEPRLLFTPLSATLGGDGGTFQLEAEDRSHPVLRKRLEARKPVTLEAPKDFEKEVCRQALRLAERHRMVAVVVNRVASARDIFERLRADKQTAYLLTGRIREWDRQRLAGEHLHKWKAGRDRTQDETAIVVATQTIEAGADLDFDAMVTECAPLDALRQRFGRLNRMGELEESEGVVLLRPVKGKGEDPVYGAALRKTWEWLSTRGAVDFGVAAMEEACQGAPEEVYAERPNAPLLLPPYLEAWIQTRPSPEPDPDPAYFLHGPRANSSPDVQIVWRNELTEGNQEWWAELAAQVPPRAPETLAVPAYAVRNWLREEKAGEVADVEGSGEENRQREGGAGRAALLWLGPDESRVARAEDVFAGATLVVPASYGGADEWGWHPGRREPVRDVADEVYEAAGRGRRVRVRGIEDVEALREDAERLEELAAEHGLTKGMWKCEPMADGMGLVFRTQGRVEWSDEPKQSEHGARVGLEEHTEAVVVEAEAMCRHLGLRDEERRAVLAAAEWHDAGKADSRFQQLLRGGAEEGGPVLAKSGERPNARRYRALRALTGWPAEYRHEGISVALAEEALREEDRELARHLIGSHHGWGRPWFPMAEDSEPVEVEWRGARASSAHGLHRLASGWIDQFEELNRRYGPWGLAFLEMVVRRADWKGSSRGAGG